MAVDERKFYAKREQVVEFVKYAGQFILDNADDIVGDFHALAGIKITADVNIDSIPVVDVHRTHQVADWNSRRKYIVKEVEDVHSQPMADGDMECESRN